MNELILSAPETLAARLEAERYGVTPTAADPACVYRGIAEVLALELHDLQPVQATGGLRPRHRRNAVRSVWAALVPVERLRSLVRGRGACRESGIEFFPDPDELPDDVYEQACDLALSVCDGCPVRVECAELAIRTDERWGIWGGMTADERALEAARRSSHRRLSEQEAS